MARLLVCLVVFVAGVGCTSTTVKQNPGPHDHGFRFYRPKPYLLITPVPSTDAKDAPEFVKIEWQMLPDFSEQYSVHARAGLGVNNTKVTLDNGWNLTKIDFDMDSKTDENIKAVGSLIKSVGGAFGASAAESATGRKHLVTARMPARNVPLGLYEAVIGRDPAGVKRLYGWRYVGFVPYAPCPVDGSGSQAENCAHGQIFGLVSEGGVMVFKRLEDIGQEPLEPADVRPPGPASTAELQAVVNTKAVADILLASANQAVTPGNTVTGLRATAVDKATLKFDVSVGLAVPVPDQHKTSNAIRTELQKAVRVQKGLARVDVSDVNLINPKQ